MSKKIITKTAPAPRHITTRKNATERRWAHVSPLANNLPVGWTLKLDWIRRTSPCAAPFSDPNSTLPPLPKPRAVGSIVLIHKPRGEAWTKTFKVSSTRGALVSLRGRQRGPADKLLTPHGFRPLTETELTTLPTAAQKVITALKSIVVRG
jgi:hypothetical protein